MVFSANTSNLLQSFINGEISYIFIYIIFGGISTKLNTMQLRRKIKKKNVFEIQCLNKEHIIYSFEFCNIHLNDGLIALLPPQANFLSVVLKRSSTYVRFLALIKF